MSKEEDFQANSATIGMFKAFKQFELRRKKIYEQTDKKQLNKTMKNIFKVKLD